jgi:hypothetical protein
MRRPLQRVEPSFSAGLQPTVADSMLASNGHLHGMSQGDSSMAVIAPTLSSTLKGMAATVSASLRTAARAVAAAAGITLEDDEPSALESAIASGICPADAANGRHLLHVKSIKEAWQAMARSLSGSIAAFWTEREADSIANPLQGPARSSHGALGRNPHVVVMRAKVEDQQAPRLLPLQQGTRGARAGRQFVMRRSSLSERSKQEDIVVGAARRQGRRGPTALVMEHGVEDSEPAASGNLIQPGLMAQSSQGGQSRRWRPRSDVMVQMSSASLLADDREVLQQALPRASIRRGAHSGVICTREVRRVTSIHSGRSARGPVLVVQASSHSAADAVHNKSGIPVLGSAISAASEERRPRGTILVKQAPRGGPDMGTRATRRPRRNFGMVVQASSGSSTETEVGPIARASRGRPTGVHAAAIAVMNSERDEPDDEGER